MLDAAWCAWQCRLLEKWGRGKALLALLLFELLFLSELMKKLACILRNAKGMKESVTSPHQRWRHSCCRGIFLHSSKRILKSGVKEQPYCPDSPTQSTFLFLEEFPFSWCQREKEGCGNSHPLLIFFPNYEESLMKQCKNPYRFPFLCR